MKFKKTIVYIMVVLLLMPIGNNEITEVSANSREEYENSYEDFSTLPGQGYTMLSDYIGTKKDVVIPSFSPEGSPWLIVGESFGNKGLRSVDIPKLIGETFSYKAFEGNQEGFYMSSTEDYHESAEDGDITFYQYEVLSNDTISIIDYTGSNESIDIPNKLAGRDVTRIDTEAFKEKGLKEITIPNTVKKIGYMAFFGNDFTKVIIPESVESVGEAAFGSGGGQKDAIYIIKGKKTEFEDYVFSQTTGGMPPFMVSQKDFVKVYSYKNSPIHELIKADNAGGWLGDDYNFINIEGEIDFSANGNSTWTNGSRSTKVTVKGNTEDQLLYNWTQSPALVNNGWQALTNNSTLNTPSSTGEHYLHIRGVNFLGNQFTASSKAFKIDKTNPNATLTQSPIGATNKDVTITVNPSDSHSGVKEVVMPDGKKQAGSSNKTYKVTENGTYQFKIVDNAGNVSSESITINNIDKVPPNEPEITAPTGWQKDNVSVTITHGSDSGGSGVDYTEYQIGDGSWTKYNNGVSILSAGETTIKARTVDKAGNKSSQATATVRIDKTSPTVSFGTNGGDWAQSHTTEVNISDSGGSGLKNAKYKWATSSSFPTSGTFNSVTSGTTLSALTSTGNHYLHIEATDGAGNVTKLTSEAFKVDGTDPEITLSADADITSTTHKDVIITAKVSDKDSGVKEVIMPDGSVKKSDSDKKFIATKNGTYDFTVVDKAGNETKQSYTVDNIVRELSLGNISLEKDSLTTEINKDSASIGVGVNDIDITDWRDETNNWKLTVEASKLKNNSHSYGEGVISLDKVNLSKDEVDKDGQMSNLSKRTAIDDGSVMIAQGKGSRGEFSVNFKDNALDININSSEAKIGKYSTELTWTLESTPTID